MTAPYSNFVTVGKRGGDFQSIQSAINAAAAKAAARFEQDTPFVISIAPGTYTENVTLQSYIDLAGAGAGQTILQGTLTYNQTDPSAPALAVTGMTVQSNLDAGVLFYMGTAAVSIRNCRFVGTLTGNDGSLIGVQADGVSWCRLDNVSVELSDGGFKASALNGVQLPFYDPTQYNWEPCELLGCHVGVTGNNAASKVIGVAGPAYIYNSSILALGVAAGTAIDNYSPYPSEAVGVLGSMIQGKITSAVSGNVAGSFCFNTALKPVVI